MLWKTAGDQVRRTCLYKVLRLIYYFSFRVDESIVSVGLVMVFYIVLVQRSVVFVPEHERECLFLLFKLRRRLCFPLTFYVMNPF